MLHLNFPLPEEAFLQRPPLVTSLGILKRISPPMGPLEGIFSSLWEIVSTPGHPQIPTDAFFQSHVFRQEAGPYGSFPPRKTCIYTQTAFICLPQDRAP